MKKLSTLLIFMLALAQGVFASSNNEAAEQAKAVEVNIFQFACSHFFPKMTMCQRNSYNSEKSDIFLVRNSKTTQPINSSRNPRSTSLP